MGDDGGRPASLSFAVGNVTIKQTWVADFTLLVNKSIESAPNFSLFAEGSYVGFENQDGGNTMETLPGTRITAFDINARDAHSARFSWKNTYDTVFPPIEELALKNDDIESVWQTVNTNMVSSETHSSNLSSLNKPFLELSTF